MKRPILLGASAFAAALLAGPALADPGADNLEVTMTVAEPNSDVDALQLVLEDDGAAGNLDEGPSGDDYLNGEQIDDGAVGDDHDDAADQDDGEAGDYDDGAVGDSDDGDMGDLDDGDVGDLDDGDVGDVDDGEAGELDDGAV